MRSRVFLILLISTSLISVGCFGFSLFLNDKISDLKLKIDELEDEKSSCENQLDELNVDRPFVVLRVDDIQDFSFREVQPSLINFCMDEKIPISLGVIPDLFGEDTSLVELVSQALKEGSEVSAHEDFTELSLEEQGQILQMSRRKIMNVLEVNVSIFTPPYYRFNSETVTVMKKTGYRILSSHVDLSPPGISNEQIINLPTTVELSTLEGEEWTQKSPEKITLETMNSVKTHGFAVIVTHPQEFLIGDKLKEETLDLFKELILILKETYSFQTLEILKESNKIK